MSQAVIFGVKSVMMVGGALVAEEVLVRISKKISEMTHQHIGALLDRLIPTTFRNFLHYRVNGCIHLRTDLPREIFQVNDN